MTLSATEAVARLREGNQRFIVGEVPARLSDSPRDLTQANPFAIVLGCADSRVPVETIFSQGIGDLFVVRVAGHVAAKSQIGSVEFALRQWSSPIVVVLGHSLCGAMMATIEAVENGAEGLSPHLLKVVDLLRPSVEVTADAEDRLDAAIRENVRGTMRLLVKRSKIISGLVREDRLKIVGAHYSLETGAVEFFEKLEI
ncbi:MAG TPA: carbonic anhydrase [Gammaproteobacteria bacterium]